MNASEKSAIMEISNILIGHYVSAISDFLKIQINPPEYQFFFKNPRIIFEDLNRTSGNKELKAIMIETNIQVAQSEPIKGNFILLLSPQVTTRTKQRMQEIW
jgi:chemotaxis protein CheY-P-specific phosphatase CheC